MRTSRKVIEALGNRGGFDDWWGNIDESIQAEIIDELEEVINPLDMVSLYLLDIDGPHGDSVLVAAHTLTEATSILLGTEPFSSTEWKLQSHIQKFELRSAYPALKSGVVLVGHR